MQSFSFKSDEFELVLKGSDDPISIFKEVVKNLPREMKKIKPKKLEESPSINAGDSEQDAVDSDIDIDEYFADKKPTKLRAILEETARYLTIHRNKSEFTKEDLFETAKSSLHYDTDWTKNRVPTLKRLVKNGFLANRPEGKLTLKAD